MEEGESIGVLVREYSPEVREDEEVVVAERVAFGLMSWI